MLLDLYPLAETGFPSVSLMKPTENICLAFLIDIYFLVCLAFYIKIS